MQRWERQEALPVHRHLHASQGSVYAYVPELDAWWSGRKARLDEDRSPSPTPPPHLRRVIVISWAAGMLLVMALLLLALGNRRERPAAELVRFTVTAPAGWQLSRYPSPAVSPDGRRVVFVATSSTGHDALWIRELDSLATTELPGTVGGVFPFWSPDSRFVGFFARGKLIVADLSGGPVRVLCDSPGFYGGTWSDDGVILFAPTDREIFRVPSTGGAPHQVTTIDASRLEVQHMWPEFLPDGRRFLYLSNVGPGGQRAVRLGSIDNVETRLVLENASHAAFVPPNVLMFVQGAALVAYPFDSGSAQLTGHAVTIAGDVGVRQPIGRGAFSVSRTGVLVYRTADHVMSQPVVFDRSGRRLSALEPPAQYDQPRFSPDEKTIAVSLPNVEGTEGRVLWLLDNDAGAGSRLSLGSTGSGPVWSPDGKSLAFTARRDSPGDLYRRSSVGGGDEEPLLRSRDWKIVTDWAAAGNALIYQQKDLETQWDLWALPLAGSRQSMAILRGASNEQQGRLSPDGGWIAYTSDESGRFELYIRQFPPTDASWKVSVDGGTQPEWRRDGRELFYVSGDRRLLAVPLQGGDSLRLGSPKPLFAIDTEGVMTTPGSFHYSASADGQRFVVNTVISRGTPTMTVVLNSTAALHE